MNVRQLLAPAVLGILLALPLAAPAQQAFKNVSPQTLERTLNGLGIQFQKAPGPGNNVTLYTFRRNGVLVELSNSNGQSIELTYVHAGGPTLELANRWNVAARFSRAILVPHNGQNFLVLRSELDVLGGCTDAMLRQLVVRFDDELRRFALFARG